MCALDTVGICEDDLKKVHPLFSIKLQNNNYLFIVSLLVKVSSTNGNLSDILKCLVNFYE